jgi:hypothetical protein
MAAGVAGLLALAMVETAVAADEGAPVTLAWDANAEPDLAGYRVHYGLTSGAPSQSVDIGKEPTVTLTGLTARTTYYVVVTAYNTEGVESFPSDEIAFSPLAVPTTTFTMEPLAAPPAGDPALTASAATISGWTSLPAGGFSFVITANPGQTLAVYVSKDMINWELLGTTSNPTGRLQAVDEAAGALTGRFYQVLPYQG